MTGNFHIASADRVATTFHASSKQLERAGMISDAVGIPLSRAFQLYARECGRAGKVILSAPVQEADPGDEGSKIFRFEMLREDRDAFKAACKESGVTMKQALTRFLTATNDLGGLALTLKAERNDIRKSAERIEYYLIKF